MRWLVAVLLIVPLLAGCLDGDEATTPDDPVAESTSGFTSTHVFPGNYTVGVKHAQLLQAGPHQVGEPELTLLESSLDGTALSLMVVRPVVDDATKVPTIMVASPYYEPLAANLIDDFGSGVGEQWERFGDQLVPHGYAMAFLALRGTSNSGGCIDFQGPLDVQDIDDAITWLAEQTWSSGNIGMAGISYDGSTAWMGAATGNPHLKTIIPMAGMPDWYGGRFINGTTHETAAAEGGVFYGPYGVANIRDANGAERAVCPSVAEFTAASDYSAATGERDPDGYWEARDWRQEIVANYEGSAFVVHALNDNNVPTSQSFPLATDLMDAGRPVKILLGQWDHEVPGDPDDGDVPEEHIRWDWMEAVKHWFDYWLKEDTSVDLGPIVQVGESLGKWRSDTAWPASNTSSRTYYLAAEGQLVDSDASSTADIQISAADQCPDCPTFATEPFDEAVLIGGYTRVPVTVTPTGPKGHVSAALLVEVEGVQTEVGVGIIDLRFAAGGETAQDITPGEPLEAQLSLQPFETEIPAGGRLLLQIHLGDSGRNDPAPTDPITLHIGGDMSQLRLTVLDVPEDSFFEPPR